MKHAVRGALFVVALSSPACKDKEKAASAPPAAAAAKVSADTASPTAVAVAPPATAPTPAPRPTPVGGATAGATAAAPTGTATASPSGANDVVPASALAGAEVSSGKATVDASALGTTVEVELLRRLGGMNGDARKFETLLVLRGAKRLVLETDAGRDGDDKLPRDKDLAPGTLLRTAPIAPRAWSADDEAEYMIKAPNAASLVYLHSFSAIASQDLVVVTADDKAVTLWELDNSANGPAKWKKRVEAKLAPGTTVTAR